MLDSTSDAESVSDSGFDQIQQDKGKQRVRDDDSSHQVDYSVLSIEQLGQIQKNEIDHVVGIIGIKVLFPLVIRPTKADSVRIAFRGRYSTAFLCLEQGEAYRGQSPPCTC